jgi:alkylhydroperoxidase/carboxymuconolactone decarboxylase family protein YurZ
MKNNGSWNPLWECLEALDPAWTEQYMRTTMQPYESGVLSPQVVQLLCIAVDASCTHMYAPGIRRHIRAALDLGVTSREILEVLKLATTVGIHTLNIGLPILMEEMDNSEEAPGRPAQLS